MSYPVISSRRMPYDVDGTVVGYRMPNSSSTSLEAAVFNYGVGQWLTSEQMALLNSASRGNTLNSTTYPYGFWFFFPEAREIENLGYLFRYDIRNPTYNQLVIQGSNDTANGIDGTWESAIASPPDFSTRADWWRECNVPISFSTSYKVIRMAMLTYGNGTGLQAIHLYGRKAAGSAPDDLLFCNLDGTEKTALLDWGDTPEGTTKIDSFTVKNSSTTKIAQGVNLQLNDSDFLLSFASDGPWTATLDIASIAANSLSAAVYVKHQLEPPSLTLGPRQPRCIATVTSWS